jgi:hypothetical protein
MLFIVPRRPRIATQVGRGRGGGAMGCCAAVLMRVPPACAVLHPFLPPLPHPVAPFSTPPWPPFAVLVPRRARSATRVGRGDGVLRRCSMRVPSACAVLHPFLPPLPRPVAPCSTPISSLWHTRRTVRSVRARASARARDEEGGEGRGGHASTVRALLTKLTLASHCFEHHRFFVSLDFYR